MYTEPNCDMDWDIYLDYLADQGFDELRDVNSYSLVTGFSRIINEDAILSGYHISAEGSYKEVACGVYSNVPEFFYSEPHFVIGAGETEFDPEEHWILGEYEYKIIEKQFYRGVDHFVENGFDMYDHAFFPRGSGSL